MITNHHRDVVSASLATALSEEAAELLDEPTPRVLDTGRLFLGGSMCRFDEARALVGDDGSHLIEMLARGATLALCGAQMHGELFASLAAAIQRATGVAPNLNVYFTSPSTPGVAPHVDDHDVAALHLSGAKTWLLGERSEHAVVLAPGDVLLVPSGLRHTTVSIGDGVAIHVAINCASGIRENPRFFDALRAGLRELETQLALAA